MSKSTIFFLVVPLALAAMPVTAQVGEKATYVGEGRYVGDDRTSSDTAVIRQRNQEQTERRQDRDRSEQRYQESERRERAYERESSSDRLY
ncbi:hypothetical protein C8R32_10224 [Nitrosospira sp. Nsp5]|uniref:Uncharacterized protein n=1 Tax=Nitrosospira multiformis TaxID=1231 RepID=A0ABY0TLA3_9PROT|nr:MULTISPECIES: hypothetical protein [Nitrosospira]PTR09938.1 hypothetical protein C8R32_10224 [Nitrosospira sp. Nsp5]SDR00925.1 hypothetical protein SAMN05216402_3232 [Nitrosospira multiformis]